MDASKLIQEATAAYKKAAAAADADDSLASRLWSEIGFVNRDYYLALMDEAKAARRQAAAENIDLLQGKEEDRIKFHIVQAYDAYVELTDGLNTTDTAEWRRLASMREEMGRACGWQPCGWFDQEEPEVQVLATYERALARDPHWTHGWTRVVVLLRKNPELRAQGGEGDLLDALDRAAAALPLSLRQNWQQSERTDVRWLRVLAASMHAERAETAESIRLIDGLGRAEEDDSIETGVLDGQGLAELYGSPWEPRQEEQPEPEAEDALVRAWSGALPPRLQEALENGFRIESDYWGVGYQGAYQGDYYSHWLDLDAEPTNAIHQAVQHIAERTLSAEERAQVSGVEWWAHRRPYLKHSASEADFNRTRYLAHHLRKRPRNSLPASARSCAFAQAVSFSLRSLTSVCLHRLRHGRCDCGEGGRLAPPEVFLRPVPQRRRWALAHHQPDAGGPHRSDCEWSLHDPSLRGVCAVQG